MSFKAELHLDGKRLNVLKCEYTFNQNIDLNGKPSARPRGGQISLTVESTADTDLFDWMISNTQTKSGSIVFYRRDTLAKMKEIRFTDAYCVEFKELFAATGEHPMLVSLGLTAKELQAGNATYRNPWPV